MGRPKSPEKLSAEEKTFLSAYVLQCNFDTYEAIKVAGIPHLNKQSAQQKAFNILAKPIAEKYIDDLIKEKKTKFAITEEEILQGIYGEAKFFGEGASHAARINAWVQLGKHFGMFSEKKQELSVPSITYNIVNYSNEVKEETEKVINQLPEEVLEAATETTSDILIDIKEYDNE